MRIGQAHVFAELFIRFFAAADAGFLFGNGDGIPFFQVVQVFLQQDVAAAGIGSAFGDNGDIADVFIALRVFSAIDKAVQSAVFIQAQAVFLSGDADAVAERGKDGLGEREGGVLAVGLDVDVNIVLG